MHRDAQEAAETCAARFRRAVVAAVDAGVSKKIVAGLAEVSPSRVLAILVREDSR